MRLRQAFLRPGRTRPPLAPDPSSAADTLLGTKKRRAVIAAGSALVLVTLGVASTAAARPSSASASVSATGLPVYDHVVLVTEENKYYDDIVGSSNAPYINSLIKQGASFTNFHGTTHPSQGNYVALFSGSLHGVDSDDCPYNFNADNLGNQLLTNGHTFVGYSESLPADGSKDCGDDGSGGYARKHNSWADFADIPASSNLRFSKFPTDFSKLPTVSFVTPNLDDDMHDGTVKAGDTWLHDHIDGYAQWAKTHNSLLIVTWDENDGDDSDNQIATMIVGAHVKPGASSGTHYNHYSLLRTLEDDYGLPALGSAATASDISGIWDQGGTTPTPPSSPPTSSTSPPAGGTDLALGRPATASSTESSSLPASNAVDGDATTRWGSKEGSDPQWISVDLGSSMAINEVKLSWEAAYGKAYTIQTSDDDKTWTTVYSTSSGHGGNEDLTVNGHGRYVRMYGTKRGTSYGYSLYEFGIYGPASALAAPPANAAANAAANPVPNLPATPQVTGPTYASPIPPSSSTSGLTDPRKKEAAMELVSSAQNSSLDWKAQYAYIEDISDGRGYTAGIAGFSSGSGDLLDLVNLYTQRVPHNALAGYLPALRAVKGSSSHRGLDPDFASAWHTAALDPAFQQAQNDEMDRDYFNPAVTQAKADGLHALGQFAYFDAIVRHGSGTDPVSFAAIRAAAMKQARTPAQGGDEATYIKAFLNARKAAMLAEATPDDTSRIDTEQQVFLDKGNLNLNAPLSWMTDGDTYTIAD
ncbi:chitosanase [Catenulispora pinisilvae]|uniref:chitosanase n=1 Tax=Catenulispora pinisilvae TaxID=2705253 RepID=UPI002B276F72|nr:chitosanase [Catenulispora pinisilvae]